jgi:2-oxoglutarate dehydrogenase E2 component (dihydrolipoamide succinyltransferase)
VKEAQQISAGLHEVGPTADEVVVTEPARLLAQERGIPDSVLRSLGKAVVRTEDVRALAGVQNTDEAKRNKRQQAVAEMVTRSHDIPAAHLTTKIFLDADLDDGPLGHVPRVVRAVTTARKTGSDVFGWYDEGRFTPAPSESVVGITVDLGTGLWVPVLRDVERLSLEDISESILEFGYKAVKERFDAVDLEGGQFTVSLPVGNGMHTSVAMILPPQVAILALGDPVNEVVPGPDGSVRTATFVDATLSYDHRVVNGREAAEFLAAVRESIENPRNHYRG